MHSHHHHAPGVWHHRTTTTTLECCKSRRTSSARRQDYYYHHKRRFFLRSPLRIGCSHSSTTSSIFNDIYRDDETFSKDASRRVAMREAEMKPDTYKHPDDSFYGEIDADSMLELIDLGTEGTFLGEEGLRYVDLGCGVGKQVAVRWTLFYFCIARVLPRGGVSVVDGFRDRVCDVFLFFCSRVLTKVLPSAVLYRRRRCRGSSSKPTAWRYVQI